MTTITRDHVRSSSTRRVRTRAFSVASAALASLAVWTIAVPLLGIDLFVRPGGGSPQTVGAGTVVAVSLIASLLGWALLALLERRTSRARAIWTGAAVAALLLSLGGPPDRRGHGVGHSGPRAHARDGRRDPHPDAAPQLIGRLILLRAEKKDEGPYAVVGQKPHRLRNIMGSKHIRAGTNQT
ncbi:MAG TPA: DUF6069 family protein [Nocardioidaceae bacterium]|nr:DUF6069 family protein [Nocardioidaceae bacterium]